MIVYKKSSKWWCLYLIKGSLKKFYLLFYSNVALICWFCFTEWHTVCQRIFTIGWILLLNPLLKICFKVVDRQDDEFKRLSSKDVRLTLRLSSEYTYEMRFMGLDRSLHFRLIIYNEYIYVRYIENLNDVLILQNNAWFLTNVVFSFIHIEKIPK